MSIHLEPSTQLGFNRPLTQTVKKSLRVTNSNPQPVAFKVKTTAPKLYCVRPNSGRIEPGDSIDVSVILQAMKEEPPLSARCKDKFLVQSTFITPDKEHLSLQDLWSTADTHGDVHQQKIKVAYLPPGETIQENDGITQSMMTEGDSHYDTVRPTNNGHHTGVFNSFVPIHRDNHLTASPIPAHQRSPSPAQGEYIIAHEETTHQENHYGSVPPSPRVSTRNRTPPPSQPNNELVNKYTEAQEEIGRLKALVATLSMSNVANGGAAAASTDGGLRRRKPRSDDGDESYMGESVDGETIVDHSVSSTESGVPLQIVAIIALGVFITTYLFF